MNEDVIVRKIKLSNANYVIQYDDRDTKQLMYSEAQRIFNQYSHIIKEDKKPQTLNLITQQTINFIKRLDEHRQILKAQVELQMKICQSNILLQRALVNYESKK